METCASLSPSVIQIAWEVLGAAGWGAGVLGVSQALSVSSEVPTVTPSPRQAFCSLIDAGNQSA